MRLDPVAVQQEIANLLLIHPELQEDDVLRSDMIEGSTGAFEFLSRVVRMIGDNTALAKSTSDYIEELRARKDRLTRREYALRSFIFKIMNSANLTKAELPEATLSIRHGQQRVVITDEASIPPAYCRIKKEPDKTAIKEALASGQHIPGATLSNSEPSLSVRIK